MSKFTLRTVSATVARIIKFAGFFLKRWIKCDQKKLTACGMCTHLQFLFVSSFVSSFVIFFVVFYFVGEDSSTRTLLLGTYLLYSFCLFLPLGLFGEHSSTRPLLLFLNREKIAIL